MIDRVLVTGGAGFIGSHVCEALHASGMRVRVLDDLSTGSRENLAASVESFESFEVFEGSVCVEDDVARAVEGCDAVVHLAALTSVAGSFLDRARYFSVNVEGTQRVADAARRLGVRRMLLASSAAVYGERPGPHSEPTSPAPTSPYAETKAEGERIMRALSVSSTCDALSFRFFNVYGPRQSEHGSYAAAIPGFVARLRNKNSVQIYGDGTQTRDFVHVTDVARAVVTALQSPTQFAGGSINIGTGVSMSIATLARTAARLANCTTCVEFGAARLGDVHESVAVIAKARDLLNFAPRVSLEAGLCELFQLQPSSRKSLAS